MVSDMLCDRIFTSSSWSCGMARSSNLRWLYSHMQNQHQLMTICGTCIRSINMLLPWHDSVDACASLWALVTQRCYSMANIVSSAQDIPCSPQNSTDCMAQLIRLHMMADLLIRRRPVLHERLAVKTCLLEPPMLAPKLKVLESREHGILDIVLQEPQLPCT